MVYMSKDANKLFFIFFVLFCFVVFCFVFMLHSLKRFGLNKFELVTVYRGYIPGPGTALSAAS